MAIRRILTGCYESCFISQYNASGVLMTNINQIGTAGYKLKYTVPRAKWVRCEASRVQSGLISLILDFSFLGDDAIGEALAHGNWVTSNRDAVASSPTTQYSILLIDSTNDTSIYIPICESDTDYNITRDKKTASAVPLRFQWFGVSPTTAIDSRSGIKYYYKDTLSTLQSDVNSVCPGSWPL